MRYPIFLLIARLRPVDYLICDINVLQASLRLSEISPRADMSALGGKAAAPPTGGASALRLIDEYIIFILDVEAKVSGNVTENVVSAPEVNICMLNNNEKTHGSTALGGARFTELDVLLYNEGR